MRIKRILSWFIPLLAISTLAYLLGYSNIFLVKKVNLNQSAQTSEISEIIAKPEFHIANGDRLARVNVRGVSAAIRKVSWVKSVKVARNWISGSVSVSVEGRVPIAKLLESSQSESLYIDGSGTIFKGSPLLKAALALPIISISTPDQGRIASDFITQLPADFRQNLNSVSIAIGGEISMVENQGPQSVTINWGKPDEISTKLAVYRRLINLPENSKISSMDLSNPKYPTVKN